MKLKQRIKRLSASTRLNVIAAAAVAVSVVIVAYALVALFGAQSQGLEAEQATLSGSAKVVSDASASGGSALQFGAAPPAVTPPAAPSGLRAVGGGRDIALQWKTPSSTSGITRYEVYRDGAKVATVTPDTSNYRALLGTRYYDTDVNRGQAYRYQVRATNADGGTSELSAAISASIPTSSAGLPSVSYDVSEAPDLQGYVDQFVKPTVASWYPKLVDVLVKGNYVPRTSFEIIYDKDYTALAEVRNGRTMVVNPEWVRDHPEDLGLYVHEMTHIVQSYQAGVPGALTEGIADWTREYVYYDRDPRPPRQNETYASGYSPASYFVNWIQENVRSDFIVAANARAHNEGGLGFGYQIYEQIAGQPVQRMWHAMTGRKISAPGHLSTVNNLCADVLNYDRTNGNTVQAMTCRENTAQQWMHVYNNGSDGVGLLMVLGKCLDVNGAGTANGTKVQIWDCNSSSAQQWVKQGDTLVNPNSNKCLQPKGGSLAPGTPLVIWECNGSAYQRWSPPVF